MLPACLDSLAGTADEIIVLDTGSTDATPALAAARDCTVASCRWPGSFADARNAALELARGRFVLSIDADERLLDGPRLRRTLRDLPAAVGGLLVEQHNVIHVLGSHRRAVHPVGVVRLFRRHPAIHFEGEVHERVDPSIERAGLAVRPSSVALLHRTDALDWDYVMRKQRRYLRMLEARLATHPADAWARLQRGKTLLGLERAEAGIRELRATARLHGADSRVQALALDYLGIALQESGQLEAALEAADDSLALAPGQSFAHFVRAEALYRAGRHREALASFSRAGVAGVAGARAARRAAMVGDLYLCADERAYHRARCLLMLGELERAEGELRRGLAAHPRSALCGHAWAHLALLRGRPREAVRWLERVTRWDPGWTTPRQLLASVRPR